jgi:hypothetical protein
MEPIGHRRWAIAEGCIAGWSNGPGPRRTGHVRCNDLEDLEPKDTDYASVIESDVPVVVQHTRLDSRQAENALLSTIAFASNE